MLPAYTKSWLDRTNKKSVIVDGFGPERFLVSVFLASEKFDSDLELDVGMHKTDAHPCTWAWVWASNVGLWCVCTMVCYGCLGNMYYKVMGVRENMAAGFYVGRPSM